MKSSIAIQVLPKVDSTKEVVRVVDKVIEYIASTGANYVVSPFETVVESDDFNLLMEIIKKSQEICLEEGAESVSSYVKIVHSGKDILTIDEKIEKYQK